MNRKVVIVLNTAWNLVNFRAGLIRAMVRNGYDVVAVAPTDKYAPRLANLGCRFVPLPMDNKGTNPGRDLVLLWRLYSLLRRERPAVFLGYTVKPNIYGSLAANLLGIPVINNIAGLGSVFISNGLLTRLVKWLYRLALSRSTKVFFQNEDDLRLFISHDLVREVVVDRLPGSGIDLDRFYPSFCVASNEKRSGFSFLLVSRMLWDKGIAEYVEAARLVRQDNPGVSFNLLGFLDVQNPAAISRKQMQAWVDEGVVNYLGVSDDVRIQISESDCLVLPSYREGVPHSLLEAAAMGCPIITTDAVGCREVVDDGVNGYLCRTRDHVDLARKMELMIKLPACKRAEMGLQGRKKMEREFDERIVINRYLDAIDQIT